ncbi:MAG: histidine kinase [Dermatophilaceae bacterium]
MGVPRAGGVKVSTLLAFTVVVCWVGIVSPALAEPAGALRAGPLWWTATIAYLVCFFGMRPALTTPRTGRSQPPAIAMAVCGVVATLSGELASLSPVLLCVTTAMIGFAIPQRWVFVVVLAEWATLAVAVGMGVETVSWAFAFAGMIAFAAIVVEISVREFYARALVASTSAELARANATLSSANADLAAAHLRLAQAQVLLAERSRAEERLRIARDLHDSIGHQVTALTLDLEVASHLAQGPIIEHVTRSNGLAREILAEMRAVVSALRDESVNLPLELTRLAGSIPTLPVELDLGSGLDDVPPSVAIVAGRLVQEALTNAARHAGASRAGVVVRRDGGELLLEVRDDGKGSDAVSPGNGLLGMSERVAAVGGSLEWFTTSGSGFAVRARIPALGAATS